MSYTTLTAAQPGRVVNLSARAPAHAPNAREKYPSSSAPLALVCWTRGGWGRIERKFQRNAQSNDWGRMAVHFSNSKTVEWATPQDFFDKMNAEFGFTLDAAATAENVKCARYLAKVLRGIRAGAVVVCLVPRESTRDGGTTSFVTPTKLVI